MKYFSTNKQSPFVDFKEATIQGQAPDKGLYFPETIPTVDKNLIVDIENISNEDIGFRVLKPYVGNTIPDENLFQIVSESISFPIPLVKISDYIYSLELFHGPTLAFKDVGARFMSRCLGFFLKDEKKNRVCVYPSIRIFRYNGYILTLSLSIIMAGPFSFNEEDILCFTGL